jgi:thioredoxin 1
MMSKVKHFTDNDFKTEVLDADRPVLVDFWATWCGPCHMLAPTIEELAKTLDGTVSVGKLDVDDSPLTAASYDIRSIPTVILFKDGREVTRLLGVRSKKELADTVKYHTEAETLA